MTSDPGRRDFLAAMAAFFRCSAVEEEKHGTISATQPAKYRDREFARARAQAVAIPRAGFGVGSDADVLHVGARALGR